jgi:hypothetical protein
VKITAERHVLALMVHHVSVDAWLYESVFREVRELYDAFAADDGGQPIVSTRSS